MSALSDAMAQALAAVASFKGESLTYRTTHAGSATALAGWVLHHDRVEQPTFITDRMAEAEVKYGTLKGPIGSPVMAIGYEVIDGNSEAWAVESVMIDNQQICRVKRSKTLGLAPDRGQLR